MATRLILIRHGETHWNKQKKYCGFKDIGLNAKGKSQARSLCKHLKSIRCDKIYCSDRKRAIQTTRIIFGKLPVTKVSDLREINFGLLEGLTHKHIMQKIPSLYQKWLRNPYKNNIPKGERLNSFRKRVNAAFKKIVKINRDKTVAVVCHGGTISIFVTNLLKTRKFWYHIPHSASISIIEYKGNQPSIKLFDNTRHLR